MMRIVPLAATLAAVVGGLAAPSAQATFPGRNGVIVESVVETAFGYPPDGEDVHVSALRRSPDSSVLLGCEEAVRPGATSACGQRLLADPEFTPDGSALVFSDGSGLATVNADGSGYRKLGPFAEGLADPSLSPDGSRIAAVTGSGRFPDLLPDPAIVVTSLSGGRLRRLGPGSRPAWSARGWIAYIRDGALYRVRPDGSARRRLVARGCTAAAWSPNGSSLAFSTVPESRRPRRHATDRGGIFISRSDGTGLRRLPPAPDDWRWVGELSWSPDGRRLALGAGSSLVTVGLRARVLERFPEVASEWVYDGEIEVTRSRQRNGIAWQPLPR